VLRCHSHDGAFGNRYGFDVDALDEEGNVIANQEEVTADSHLSHVLGSNSNKERVHEAQRSQVGASRLGLCM